MSRSCTIKISESEREVLRETQEALYGEKDAEYIPYGSTIEMLCNQQLRRMIQIAE